MICRSLQEWGRLGVQMGDEGDGISRVTADKLIAAARTLSVRGRGAQSVLIDRHTHLQAQQVVGVLTAPGVTLEILPKIDSLGAAATRHNLVHMLATVCDLKLASGAITDLGWQPHDLLEILIRLFCDQLFAAVRRGLPRRYIDEAADLTTLRGRLDLQRQFTALAVSPQKLACRYQALSSDIALNRIMKAAVCRLSSLARAPENQRRIAELLFAFADVSDTPFDRLPWESVVLDRTNIAWESLLNFARLILGRRFQTTSTGGGRGFSLVFEMNTLFEEYIGRMVRRALMGSGLEVRLQGPANHVLAEESGTLRFATRPDVVVSREGVPVLIIDTKWKRLAGAADDSKQGVEQADVYQMIAYSRVYECRRLMLLYPHHSGVGAEEGRFRTYRIRGDEDAKLSMAAISLSNLAQVWERLRDILAGELGLQPNSIMGNGRQLEPT